MKYLLSLLLILSSTVSFGQQRVILDADIDSDVDDAEALAMLHTLHKKKQINFIGAIVTSDDPYAALCVSAINTYYGKPDLPIGFLQNQPALKNHSKYTRQVSSEFPHKLKSHEEAEDAATLYRKLLSQSPDESVIIVTVGHLSSLQALLQSPPDQYSNLSGVNLVQKKVGKWLCMGGQFPEGKEANFYRPDPESTIYLLKVWPKPVVFCGWEIGKEIITGGNFLRKRLSSKNPVYRAYELYNNFNGRPSWDQATILLLTKDAKKYFDTIQTGHCKVAKDGSNTWLLEPDSQQEFIIFKTKNRAVYQALGRKIDKMVMP